MAENNSGRLSEVVQQWVRPGAASATLNYDNYVKAGFVDDAPKAALHSLAPQWNSRGRHS